MAGVRATGGRRWTATGAVLGRREEGQGSMASRRSPGGRQTWGTGAGWRRRPPRGMTPGKEARRVGREGRRPQLRKIQQVDLLPSCEHFVNHAEGTHLLQTGHFNWVAVGSGIGLHCGRQSFAESVILQVRMAAFRCEVHTAYDFECRKSRIAFHVPFHISACRPALIQNCFLYHPEPFPLP